MFRLLAIVRFLMVLASVCGAGCVSCGGVMAQSPPKSGAPTKAAPDPSARAFTEKVARGLAIKFPDLKFKVTGEFEISRTDPDGTEATLWTRNFYNDYKTDPAKIGEIIDLIAASSSQACCDGRALDRSRIVPVIKDRAWVDDNRPALKDKGLDLDFVFEDFNDELIVVYAEDTEKTMRYIMSNEDIGDRKDLRARAIENLDRLLPKVEMATIGDLSVFSAGGDYEASLLLFNDIWRGGKIKVDGDIVVAVPAKDVLMVTGSKSRKGIAAMRKLATEYHGQSRYSLTDALFVYRGGKFVKYGRK